MWARAISINISVCVCVCVCAGGEEGSTNISQGGIEGEEGRRRRTGCMLPVLAIGSRLGHLIKNMSTRAPGRR